MRGKIAIVAGLVTACGAFLVPGIDGTLGLSAPAPFYYGNPGVPVVLQVANLGDTLAPGPIPVDLQLGPGLTVASVSPAAWSCTQTGPTVACQYSGDLPAGGSIPDLELEMAVGSQSETGPDVRFCGKLRIDNDVNPNNDSICETFSVTPPTAEYDLAVEKTIWNAFDPVTNRVTYNIEVTNNGPDVMTDTMVIEDLALGDLEVEGVGWDASELSCQLLPDRATCTTNTLGVGDSVSATVRFVKLTEVIEPIDNCATVSAPQDIEPSNDNSCITFTPGQPDPFDLAVTAEIHEEPNPPFSGVYRWFITNTGPNATIDPIQILIDAPPPGTTLGYLAGVFNLTTNATNTADCTPVGNQLQCEVITILQPGDSKMLWMSFFEDQIAGSAPACLSVNPLGDTDPSNDEACLSIDIDPLPAGPYVLSLDLDSLGPWNPGAPAALRATITNAGDGEAAEPIVMTTLLPPGVQFVGLGGRSGFTCQGASRPPGGEIVTCFLEEPLDAQSTVTLDLSVWVDEPLNDDVCANVAPGNLDDQDGTGCVTVRSDL